MTPSIRELQAGIENPGQRVGAADVESEGDPPPEAWSTVGEGQIAQPRVPGVLAKPDCTTQRRRCQYLRVTHDELLVRDARQCPSLGQVCSFPFGHTSLIAGGYPGGYLEGYPDGIRRVSGGYPEGIWRVPGLHPEARL